MQKINLQVPKLNLKGFLKNSIESYARLQKLENQFQGILFAELLLKDVHPIPLLEAKKKSGGKCDILFDQQQIEIKYQYEFDIAQLHNFYHSGKYPKIANSIEKDIKNSNIFLMFILERKPAYFNKPTIFNHPIPNFNFNATLSQYMGKLKIKFPNKHVDVSKNYVQGQDWNLHILLVCDKNLKKDIII